MVTTILMRANREGIRDWLIQRFSAVILLVGVVALAGFFLMHPGMQYSDWHDLFAALWVKIAALLTFSALLLHAWLGLWIVFTDYIKCGFLRAILTGLWVIALAGCFFAACLILWSV